MVSNGSVLRVLLWNSWKTKYLMSLEARRRYDCPSRSRGLCTMSTYSAGETHSLPGGIQPSDPRPGSERLHANPSHPLNAPEIGAVPSVALSVAMVSLNAA